jgi:hypothetical protein
MSGLSSPSDGFSTSASAPGSHTFLGASNYILNINILNEILPCRLSGAFSQVGAQCFQSPDTAH